MLHKRSSLKQSEGLCLDFPKCILFKVCFEIICNTFVYFNKNCSIKGKRRSMWMKMTEMFNLPHSRNQKNHSEVKTLLLPTPSVNKKGVSQMTKINQETVFKITFFKKIINSVFMLLIFWLPSLYDCAF